MRSRNSLENRFYLGPLRKIHSMIVLSHHSSLSVHFHPSQWEALARLNSMCIYVGRWISQLDVKNKTDHL